MEEIRIEELISLVKGTIIYTDINGKILDKHKIPRGKLFVHINLGEISVKNKIGYNKLVKEFKENLKELKKG